MWSGKASGKADRLCVGCRAMREHHGQGERERPTFPSSSPAAASAACHGLCAGAQGFPGAGVRAGGEFREVGAGIQLGPNIFRVLEKIGLKDEMLADA